MSLPLHRSSAALPVVTGFASVPPLLQDSWYTSPKDVGMISMFALGILVLCGILFPESKLAYFLAKCPVRRYVKRRYKAWRYLVDGPAIIQEGYDQSNGQPFEVFAPDARYVFVSSPEHVNELASAPDSTLSLYYASRQVLQPQYTMHRFGWYDKPLEGTGFVRALRVHLTNNLASSLPGMKEIVRRRFNELQAKNPVVAAKNEEFVEKTLDYVEQLVVCAEILRASPTWLAPIIGRLIGRRNTAQKFIFETLIPIVTQRCKERELASQGVEVPKHNDCIQWILDSSSRKVRRTPAGVAHELMAVWFASVHPTSITIVFAIQDLCLHPEYIEPIRHEVSSQYSRFESTAQGLPLLDSFIKESARLSPVESQSVRRRALAPFSLSDGTKVSIGDWACTPVTSIMQDGKFYPSPDQFSGFRFAPEDIVANIGGTQNGAPTQDRPSKLVDSDNTFYMWGVGKQSCPGRFYAAALAKLVIAHLVDEYDFHLVNPEAPRWFTWRTCRIPREDVMVVFTPRKE